MLFANSEKSSKQFIQDLQGLTYLTCPLFLEVSPTRPTSWVILHRKSIFSAKPFLSCYEFFSPHNILVTFYISCHQWQWGFCSTTSSVRWQDTFPLQRGYFFVVVIVKCLHAYFLIKKQHHSLAQFFEPPVHQQEHAKPLRESITYYLCTHEENELIMPEIKK